MAIGWAATIPWGEVIKAVPEIIEGAKKLWSAVRKTSPTEPPQQPAETQASPEALAISELKYRIDSLEATSEALQNQMQVSSDLIKTLADQNGQLVARIEIHRRRLIWLTSATIISIVVSAVCIVLLLAKGA